MDGIGATEMLHIFIGAPRGRDPPRRDRQGLCPGYEAKVVDEQGRDVPRRVPSAGSRCAGRPAAAISRTSGSANTSQDGWNITGDTYLMDEDGYFWYQARSDDMIVSSGYNIAGPEVEAALLTHPPWPNAASSARRTRSAA